MDDTIEICSGCGKMPRSIDSTSGFFLCTRCGNRATTHVTADDYEKTVLDLDHKFHEALLRQRHEAVKKEPIKFAKPKKGAKAKAVKKAAPKKAKPSKKSPKKTTRR